jgi:hypothetical protein
VDAVERLSAPKEKRASGPATTFLGEDFTEILHSSYGPLTNGSENK